MSEPRPSIRVPTLTVVAAADLEPAARAAFIDLCSRAYDEDYAPLFDLLGGPSIHVLAHCEDRLVGHACWVTRWLQPAGLPVLRTAYVEGVAVAPPLHGQGIGSAVMRRVAAETRSYDLGGLSTGRTSFYARLGWELWTGPLAIRDAAGLTPTPDDLVMILRTPHTPALDVTTQLTAEWRPGEVW